MRKILVKFFFYFLREETYTPRDWYFVTRSVSEEMSYIPYLRFCQYPSNLRATKFDRWEANARIREVKVKVRRDGRREEEEGVEGGGENAQSHVTGNRHG